MGETIRNYVTNKNIEKDFAFHIHKFFLKKIPKIICTNDPIMELLVKFYGLSDKQLFRAPETIQLNKFKMYPRKTSSKPNVLFIGGDFIRKGGDILIKNLDKFINNCNLTVVTKDKRAKVNNVNYFDSKLSDDQILDLYRTHDIFVLPSCFESFGLVLAEAAAAGLVVITTKFALGSKDIVTNNKTGFITETQEQCIDMLTKLIKDPKKIDDFKIAAYNKMESEFAESRIYDKYIKIINQP